MVDGVKIKLRFPTNLICAESFCLVSLKHVYK